MNIFYILDKGISEAKHWSSLANIFLCQIQRELSDKSTEFKSAVWYQPECFIDDYGGLLFGKGKFCDFTKSLNAHFVKFEVYLINGSFEEYNPLVGIEILITDRPFQNRECGK